MADGSPRVATGAGAGDTMIRFEDVTKRFGGLVAVNEVSFEARETMIHAIIGPNGSGKTTLINCLTGVYRPDSGRITLGAHRLDHLPPWTVARAGIARTFQTIRLWKSMTVLENAMVGHDAQTHSGILSAILRSRAFKAEERAMRERAMEALEFVGLEERARSRAGDLPYGRQRLLEIARALCTEPRVLVLDEPAAGMNPNECEELTRRIAKLKDHGLTVLFIEHNMRLVMGLSDWVTVLDFGRKIAEGPPGEVRANPAVITAYLGQSRSRA